jgi:predicted Zn-dependent protease
VWCGCDRFYEQRKQHYFNKGKELYEKGEYKDAAREFKNALAFDNKYFDALYMRGMSFSKHGNWKLAKEGFKAAIAERPERMDVRLAYIENMLKYGKGYKLAYINANRALEIDRHNKEAMYLKVKGLIKRRRGAEVDDAESEISLLLNQDCNDHRIYCLLAEIKILRGKLTEAEEILKQHYTADEDWTSAMMFLAERYEREWKNEQVVEIYEEIIGKVEDKYPYQKALADFFRKVGEEEEEEKLLREMVRSYPDVFQVKSNLIDFLLYYDRAEEAEKLILSETEKAPENFTLIKMLVKLHKKSGNMEKAIGMAKKMLAAIEEDSIQYFEMENIIAGLYFQNGNYKVSKFISRGVLEKSPKDIQARFNLCRIELKGGDVVWAIGGLRQLASENPNNPKYYYYLGLAHELKGEEIMAEKAFCDSLDVSPGYKDALLKLSDIYQTRGYYSELKSRIKNYLKVKPKDEAMLSLLESVKSKAHSIL